MLRDLVNLPVFNHLFFNGSPVKVPAAKLGVTNEYSRILPDDYTRIFKAWTGVNNHGCMEILPNTLNPTCSSDKIEGTNNRKKLLDEIKGDNNVVYSRFYMDIDVNKIDEIINWDQITDNLNSLYPDVFKYAIYAISGYATEEAFQTMFKGFTDQFQKQSYTYAQSKQTINYYYCIEDNLIAYIELRDNKDIAGHMLSLHSTCCNVVYSLTKDTLDKHIAFNKNCYIGTDPAVYTKWRAMRPSISIKYDADADEHKSQQNINKAVHLGYLVKIFKKLIISNQQFIDELVKKYHYSDKGIDDLTIIQLLINIFFPGIIAFKSESDLIVYNLYEITPDKFTGKFSDKIDKSKYPDVTKISNGNSCRNINKDFISLKVDSKKYNKDLLTQIKSGHDFRSIIKERSIFCCFKVEGSTQFVNSLFELSYAGKIYAPADEFCKQLEIWYNYEPEHTSYTSFDKFYQKAFSKRLQIEEYPSMITDSISKNLRNAFHKALYPNTTYNELVDTWNKISKKLSTDKFWNDKHVAIAKKFIEQLMAHTMPSSIANENMKQVYENMFKIYIPSNKTVFDDSLSNSNDTSNNGDNNSTQNSNEEYIYIKDASSDFIKTHSTLVVKQIKSLINCIRENYNISSIEAFENDLHEYLDNWDNQLRCNMFENKYSYGYLYKDMPKLYYRTIIDSAIYKVVSKMYKGNFMVQHIQISKSIFIEDGYTDYDFKNLPRFMDKNSVMVKLHDKWIESMYNEYKNYMQDNDGESNDPKEKAFLDFEYAKSQWLKYLRQTFVNDEDFNYYLSWYHYKLNNEVVDRNMLNYGNQDCLKSTLTNMIIDAGFDFGTARCSEFIDKFDYSVMNHTATILEELEHIDPFECNQLVQKLKDLFKSNYLWTQDKNVKRFQIDRRVDFDITTNDSTYIASKLFGNCPSPDAITKRICVIERKSLPKNIIYNQKLFPCIRNNSIWNILMIAWIKYDFNTDVSKKYKLFTLDEMISYKDSYKTIQLITEIKDNQHQKLERYMFIENDSTLGKLANNGKQGNLASLVLDIARPCYNKYDLKLTGFKDLYRFVHERYNIEIFNKPDNMPAFMKNIKDNYDNIEYTYNKSNRTYRIDIDNLNKLVKTFCDYSYSLLLDVKKSDNNIYMLPTIEQMENGYADKLCTDNTEDSTPYSIKHSEDVASNCNIINDSNEISTNNGNIINDNIINDSNSNVDKINGNSKSDLNKIKLVFNNELNDDDNDDSSSSEGY